MQAELSTDNVAAKNPVRPSKGMAEFLPQPPPSAAPERNSEIYEIASAISLKMGSRYI